LVLIDVRGDMGSATTKKSAIEKAAKDLFDNRLGWSGDTPPYIPAPLVYWFLLGVALYGKDDKRTRELG